MTSGGTGGRLQGQAEVRTEDDMARAYLKLSRSRRKTVELTHPHYPPACYRQPHQESQRG